MRLAILDYGHSLGNRLLFHFIAFASRQPVPGIVKLMKYRADFFGKPMSALAQRAMRGPSAWSVGDRELMAAVIAQANACRYCVAAHSAVAALAYHDDEARVAAVLANPVAAPIAEPLRATLSMLTKLTHTHHVTAEDMSMLLTAGASRAHIEDALAVSFAFNIINRLADAFAFPIPDAEAFAASARFLLSRGYR
jgi:uncharacterized peroxidase-related enzyme